MNILSIFKRMFSTREKKSASDAGEFYISEDECVTCGCCHSQAPQNIGWLDDDKNSCSSSTVFKQPKTPEEIRDIVSASSICMTECIYYRGNDPTTIKLMHDAGIGYCVISS